MPNRHRFRVIRPREGESPSLKLIFSFTAYGLWPFVWFNASMNSAGSVWTVQDVCFFRGDQAVPLSPKAADVLLLLVQNPGSVVEKKELLNRVWHDAFVEEDSLTRTISILRKLLEAGYGGQECIATVSNRGYRLVVPVSETTEPKGVASERRC